MGNINNTFNKTQISENALKGSSSSSNNNAQSTTSSGEKNRTDPKVCHDPKMTVEGIVRIFYNQNKVMMEDQELSTVNEYDSLRIDGIEYPLIAINNRNIENNNIYYMNINYRGFLPTIKLNVQDIHQNEQKINTTQMSSIIRVCMVAKVDNIYKKILLNFRTYDVRINDSDPTNVTYFGTMYIPGFREIHNMHIWMESVCSKENCGQGGHINANTWEMLHKIAELSELGFAATDKCKDIPDHVIRNIYSQRFDKFIETQLLHCGVDEENLFDAWVDLYGYIVMVNVPWVMSQDVKPDDFEITATIGIQGTSNDLPKQEPCKLPRILTNYNLTGAPSNLEINSYCMDVDNHSIQFGTLEKVYTQSFDTNITTLSDLDVQTKQDSIDGEHIEDYNTGKNRPIPVYDFNDDKWTGLSGGYNLNQQKSIRNAYFRKKRQSILNVELKNINFGLQRGTLVYIAIFDNDPINKKVTFDSIGNIVDPTEEDIKQANLNLPSEMNEEDIIMDGGAYMPNIKLTGFYYIDGMSFNYERKGGRIVQILHLIKKGMTSGYENRHNSPKLYKFKEKSTLPASATYIKES